MPALTGGSGRSAASFAALAAADQLKLIDVTPVCRLCVRGIRSRYNNDRHRSLLTLGLPALQGLHERRRLRITRHHSKPKRHPLALLRHHPRARLRSALLLPLPQLPLRKVLIEEKLAQHRRDALTGLLVWIGALAGEDACETFHLISVRGRFVVEQFAHID